MEPKHCLLTQSLLAHIWCRDEEQISPFCLLCIQLCLQPLALHIPEYETEDQLIDGKECRSQVGPPSQFARGRDEAHGEEHSSLSLPSCMRMCMCIYSRRAANDRRGPHVGCNRRGDARRPYYR